MSAIPSLETLQCFIALAGLSARHGHPPALCAWPGAFHPSPFPPGVPMHRGALVHGATMIIHRHPHVFIVEPDGTAWCLTGAPSRLGGYMRRGKRAGVTPVVGPVAMKWGRGAQFIHDAVRYASAMRAGNDPTPGKPDTYALPHRGHQAAWVRWTAQDEARYLAHHAPPCPPGHTEKPMHRLEAEIARDTLEVEASRAAASVMRWLWQNEEPALSAATDDAAAACTRLKAAASRLRIAGGSPGSILAQVATAYRRLDPTGYVGFRLSAGANIDLAVTGEEAA